MLDAQGFWNGTTWLKDECKGTIRKFETATAARAAALRAYAKAEARGEQLVDRWYLLGGGDTSALFV